VDMSLSLAVIVAKASSGSTSQDFEELTIEGESVAVCITKHA